MSLLPQDTYTSLIDLPAHAPESKQGFLIYFFLNVKEVQRSNLEFQPNMRKQEGLKAEKKREVAIPCHVQNVDKTVKKQEHISNIMSPVLKQLKQVMAELEALQMSMN